MEQLRTLGLVDRDGKPLAAHIDGVLAGLVGRLRQRFPALQDDVTIVDVMEEAGRRLARREEELGPVEKLQGYAWTAVQRVAIARLRRGSLRLIQRTLEPHVSAAMLAITPATFGSADQIERNVLLQQIRAALSDEEWELFQSRFYGYTSKEIAWAQGRSVAAVDTLLTRTRQKLRGLLG